MAITKDFIVKNGLQVLGVGSANSTSTTTGALIVNGGVGIWKDAYIEGKLTVRGGIDGTITTASNIAGGALGSIVYQTGAGVTDTLPIGSAGQVLSVSSGTVKWIDFGAMQASTATDAYNVFVKDVSASTTTVYLALAEALGDPSVASKIDASTNLTYKPSTGLLSAGKLSLASSSNASDTTSGALVVTGGAGVGLNLVVGGTTQLGYNSDNWLQFQGASAGNPVTISSVGTDNTIDINLSAKGSNGKVVITSTATSSGQTSGALVVNGGVGVAGSIAAGNIYDNGNRVLHDVAVTGGTSISVSNVSTASGVMSFTINNDGVTSVTGTTYLGVSGLTGNITLTNLGVQTVTAGVETTVTSTGVGGTGTVSINVTSTLDNVVQRGGTTTGTIWINNTATSNTSTNGALIVTGGLGVGENVNIGGTLNVWGPTTFGGSVAFNGTATFVYSTNTFYTDNLISLHDASTTSTSAVWTYDDGKDIGHVFHYYNRTDSTGTAAALLFANDSQWFELYDRGSEIGSIFSGTNYGSLKGDKIYLTSTVNATTASGTFGSASLQTLGGASVAKDLYVGGTIYSGGNQVITSANIGTFGVTSLTAGTDTVVSTSTGGVTVWNNSTLQSVTNRGSTTTNAITINNTAVNTGTVLGNALMVQGGIASGAGLYVDGDAHIEQNVYVDGNITFYGTATQITGPSGVFYGDVNGFGALYAGKAGYTPTPSTVIQSSADVNDYAQNNFQNTNNGVTASTDWVATAANGNDTNFYIDMGITSGNWDGTQANSLGTALGANDGYLYVQGGDLVIGTRGSGDSVKIISGGAGSGSIVAVFNAPGTASTGTSSGALVVDGGLGVSGDINVGGVVYSGGKQSITDVRPSAGSGISITSLSTASGVVSFTVNNTGVLSVTAGTDISVTTSTGNLTISDTSTLQSVTNRGSTTTNAITISSTAVNTTSISGNALAVSGGIGASSLYLTGNIYLDGVPLYTTSTVGVTNILAGDGISVSASTGSVTITNTGVLGVIGGTDITLSTSSGVTTINDASTLQSVTGRGATTTNAINITNATQTTGTNTGALTVAGGVGIAKDVWIGGDLNVDGSIYLKGAGLDTITSTTGTFDYIVAEGTGTGLSVTDSATVGGTLVFGPAAQASSFASVSTSTAAPLSLDNYSASAYRTAKYVCQVVDGTAVQVEELLVFHNGTNAYIIRYGIGSSDGELGEWDATLFGGVVTLKFTPNYNPTALTVKTLRTAITA